MTDSLDLKPLFPLPDVVLFPRTLLPVHIFEPRYRLMTAEALRGDREICLALLKPGWETDYYGSPEVYPVACVGKIVQHEELADGRFNLVLHGETKVLIEGFERETPYRVARLRPVNDDAGWLTTPTVGQDAANLVRLFGRFHAGDGMALALGEMFGAHMSPEAILNTVAMNLGVDAEIKERLLAVESLGARYRAVVRILEEASTTQERIDLFRHLHPRDSRQN